VVLKSVVDKSRRRSGSPGYHVGAMPVLDLNALIDNRVRAISDYHRATGLTRAELDISGGIDSGVMLGLLVRALGADNITAAYSSINSSTGSRDRARVVAKAFGVRLIELELGPVFADLVAHMREQLAAAGYDLGEIDALCARDGTVLGSLRSCLRAPIGRALNRLTAGGIRHGTGNECEDRWLRFYQKGGDGEVDTNPIAMLAKGEVYQLAQAIGVPRELIDALPTPDLQGVGEAHNDEDELQALTGVAWSYSRIDADGNYRVVGTIERMSRLLDDPGAAGVFGPADLTDEAVAKIVAIAQKGSFPGFAADKVAGFIRSARKMERVTRHKWNPNCPTLGERGDLVAAGILSDSLPDVGAAS